MEIVLTKDNSPTLYNKDLKTYYHSLHGAVQESEYVFIKNGWEYIKDNFDIINVLEIGFGSGMNCFLMYQKLLEEKSGKIVNYFGVEKFALDSSIVEKLSIYKPFSDNVSIFLKVHSSNLEVRLSENFLLKKICTDVNEALEKMEDDTIQLVYYDAFAPSSQPEMWKKEIFEKLHVKMVNGGVLVTFCAKGQFKRDLKQIGFEVQTLKGAMGKREMARAIKII